MVYYEMPTPFAIIFSLLIGALVRAWQGFWVAYVKIPAFIVTLAGMLIFRGLTMVVLEGKSIAPFPEAFQNISSGFVPDLFSATNIVLTLVVDIILSTILVINEIKIRKTHLKYNLVVAHWEFSQQTYEGIPNILVILVVLMVAYRFVTTKMKAGRHIYAIGGNEKAA